MKARLIKAFFTGLLLFGICAVFIGGGHGTAKPMIALFPVPFMAGDLLDSYLALTLFGLLQFPLYTLLISKAERKYKAVTWIALVLVHIALAIAACRIF